jgi:DNA-binding response OmpR family regulator
MSDDQRARILIAEGDKDARAAAMWCLLSEGFWVDPVSNGFDAAVALEAPAPPDVAIIDLGLQGFDGRRLIEEMRASPRLRGVPIIATGFIEPFAPLPRGVAFLKKPCDPTQLVATVRRLGGSLTSFFPSRRPRGAARVAQELARRALKSDD